jgi:hypothetical protein
VLAVELREGVGSELRVSRADDAPRLVDPDHRRDVSDVVELGDDVLGVDQAGMRRPRLLDERPRVVG